MKKKKVLFVLIYCIIISLSFIACDTSKISDYSIVSANIVWKEGEKIQTEYPGRIYYKIKDVPTDEYIACRWRAKGFGEAFYPVLMQHKDYQGKWELDASSAKLIMSATGLILSDDAWHSFGQSILVQEVHQIDSAFAEQLANSIMVADYLDYDDINESGIHFDRSNYICDSEGNFLSLHFTLKDYNNLSWIAYILKHNGTYYIEINEDIYKSQYLLCGAEFASIIDKVCNEYDLN